MEETGVVDRPMTGTLITAKAMKLLFFSALASACLPKLRAFSALGLKRLEEKMTSAIA